MRNPLPLCLLGAVASTLLLSSCEAVNRPGDIVGEKILTYNGKYYLQQRIIRATNPYETELRTVQFPIR